MNAPVAFTWDGEAMKPTARGQWLCNKQFAVGETYPMIVHEERSTASHSHYFAAVNECWKNLPEKLTRRYPTSEHLRKWALIKAGYFDERSVVCETAEEALKVGSFIKPMDEFAVVVVSDSVVKVFTAKSQSARAMNKQDFQNSKTSVLEIVAELIGVDVGTLSSQVSDSSPTATPLAQVTDAPAAEPPPETVAGQQIDAPIVEASLLGDDWRHDYLTAMRRVDERPKSLPTRHTEALQMIGGKANAEEQQWMTAVYKLTKRRLQAEITSAEFDEAIREIS